MHVICSGQVGRHEVFDSDMRSLGGGKRKSYGHSLVVNPWGEKLLDMGGYSSGDIIDLETKENNDEDETDKKVKLNYANTLQFIDIDVDQVDGIRGKMPLASHERVDVQAVAM